MKIFNNMKSNLIDARKAIRRFPITILLSLILTTMLIYLNELNLDYESSINLRRINMVLGLGIPLSLSVALYMESFTENVKTSLIAQIGSIFLLPIYYSLLLKDFSFMPILRYSGTIIFLILAVFYGAKLKKNQGYEKYVIKVIAGGFITFIYSVVLYLGLAAILFTIESLFDVNINGKIYYYIFLIVVFVFGISQFLSKIPKKDENPSSYDYSKALKILLTYIVIPLISIYTLILMVYLLRIIITWEWPRGLVSHLVLWYASLSVGIIFLITPLVEENMIAKTFKRLFPIIVLPILAMMFISIGLRINQYGFTENRYFVVVLGLWVLGIMIYFNIKKLSNNIVIPISLSIIILLSLYGPVSSFAISKRSQNNRLEEILASNNMLVNGQVIANQNTDTETKREINNILSYFDRDHSLDDIRLLPDGFDLAETKDLFGFEHTPEYYYNENYEQYFGYYNNMEGYSIVIGDYDYLFTVQSWNQQELTIDNIQVNYNLDTQILEIKSGETVYISSNIKDIALEVHEKLREKGGPGKDMVNMEDMTYDIENQLVNVKLIFSELNGYINTNTNTSNLQSARFIILLDLK